MFLFNLGVRMDSSGNKLDIGRSREGISVERSGLMSGEFLIDLVSQGSVFVQYSLSLLSELLVLLDQEDHRLLFLFHFEGTVSWVETEGVFDATS